MCTEACDPHPPKTEAYPSDTDTSITGHPHQDRLACPDITDAHVKSSMSIRSNQLSSRFKGLEERLSVLQAKLRNSQAQSTQGHAEVQVRAFQDAQEDEGKGGLAEREERRWVGSGGSPDPWRRVFSSGSMESCSSWSVGEAVECDHPIQVDGASDTLPSTACSEPLHAISSSADPLPGLHWQSSVESDTSGMLRRISTATDTSVFPSEPMAESSPLTSLSSLSTLEEGEGEGEVPHGTAIATCISQQLESFESIMDDELTESSSDEEDGGGRGR